MKRPLFLVIFLGICSFLKGQTDNEAELVQQLLQTRDATVFAELEKVAREKGLPNQILTEARFLYLVDQNDPKQLVAFLPTLEKQQKELQVTDSVIFSTEEDYHAIVHYVRALKAQEAGDTAGFKKEILEAFWLSPAQAQVFAEPIEAARNQTEIAKMKVNFEQKFLSLTDDSSASSLKEALGDSPGLVLHFWSPFSAPSTESFPQFRVAAAAIEKAGLPVASILLAGNPEGITQAKSFMAENSKPALPGIWLRDDNKASFSVSLRVRDFPTVVLVRKDGSVAYNGHPGDPTFWEEAKKLAPKLQRPDAPELSE